MDDDTYKIIVNTACSPDKIPAKLSSFFAYIQDPYTAHRSTLVEKIDKLVKKYNNEDRGREEMTLAEALDRQWLRGIDEGMEKGIRSLVKRCLTLGASKEQIIESLIQDFNLDETAATAYFQRFSERN